VELVIQQTIQRSVGYIVPVRGKSPFVGRFPNMGRCIISYQEVLRSALNNINH
jgi:hypothetical protein